MNSSSLIIILKNDCWEIENELKKFQRRSKRSLVNELGSAIRYVTGNSLDQDDLTEINQHLDTLFKNQENLLSKLAVIPHLQVTLLRGV